MDMTGSYRIGAPREEVWEALNDIEVLQLCIPGCHEIEQTSPTAMTAKVLHAIGPVKARFAGEIELSNINAPASYTISGVGQGGAAGFANGGADVVLIEEDGVTILTFVAKAKVGGKLARLGNRLVHAAAKKLATQFFDNFHKHLNERDPPPG